MIQNYDDSLKREVYRNVLEQNLETFRSREVKEVIDQDFGYRKVSLILDEIVEETDLTSINTVDKPTNIYSFRSYQDLEELDSLGFRGRVAIDELVQSILQRDSLEKKEVRDLTSSCNKFKKSASRQKWVSKIEYRFRELPFIEFNQEEEIYTHE